MKKPGHVDPTVFDLTEPDVGSLAEMHLQARLQPQAARMTL